MTVNKIIFFCFLVSIPFSISAQTTDEDALQIKAIFDNTLSNSVSYDWLRHLCKNIGGRLSGSPSYDKAADYTYRMLDSIGADTVWKQATTVNYWERGKIESATLLGNKKSEHYPLSITALGGSAATPPEGITAEVIEVLGLEGLEKLDAAKVKGKIIFFNSPMNPTYINTFRAYGEAGAQRFRGPKDAALKGAVAVLVRSMTTRIDDFPHTGMTGFGDVKPIPAAGISTQDAGYLSEQLKTKKTVKVTMKLSAKELGKRTTHSVIADIRGSKYPNEIIVVGGHLDSWDVAEGAHDDGAGCMQAMEVLHLFKRLNIKPQRTIRCVLFANEENGTAGSKTYFEYSKNNAREKIIAALESDSGGFTPRGFRADALPDIMKNHLKTLQDWRGLLAPYGFYEMRPGGSGTDINPLRDLNAVLFGLEVDSQRYFDYHHATSDVFEAVNKRELELGAAGMSALVYLIDKYGF